MNLGGYIITSMPSNPAPPSLECVPILKDDSCSLLCTQLGKILFTAKSVTKDLRSCIFDCIVDKA